MRIKSKKEEEKKPEPTSICYCDGERRVGEIELHCVECRKWFHQSCLKDLKAFYGLPFMVCYQFYCKPCSPQRKEIWTVKQANFSQMLVMVLSNLTHNWRKAQNSDVNFEQKFFSLEHDIIPFIEKEWDNLTSMPKRKKDSWHQTIQNALEKHPDLFVQRGQTELHFKLKENDLRKIGPFLDAVRYINRRPNASQNNQNDDGNEETEGPKTRGAAKRRNAETSTGASKKQKATNDYVSVYIPGVDYIDFPFNRDGYRYFYVEPDVNCPYSEEELTCLSGAGAIPSVSYRIYNFPEVTLSPNDRAHQLRLSEDRLTLSGSKNLGYCAGRGSHMVAKGRWYYEVTFDKQAKDSHIRVGFAQELLPLQACVGYTKLSYGFRSKLGTKFHDSIGQRYLRNDFKEGDVIGCLIDLPEPARVTSRYLPPSKKDMILVFCKNHMFYEQKDDLPGYLKQLEVCHRSRIEFFLNGVSCGVAYENIYVGQYYPAVSIYQEAQVTCNFGPKLQYLPPGARPFSDRVDEYVVEQTLSDMLGALDWKERQLEEKKKEKEKADKNPRIQIRHSNERIRSQLSRRPVQVSTLQNERINMSKTDLGTALEAVLVNSCPVPEGTKEIHGYDFNEPFDFGKLMESYLTTGCQATSLGCAIEEINKMITARNEPTDFQEGINDLFTYPPNKPKRACTIFLGYTSNLVSSGLRDVIRYLAEHNMVDCIVTSAGGVEEDLIKCLAPSYLGDFGMDGAALRSQGLNRAGNVLIPNDNYCKFETWLTPILDELQEETRFWTPSSLIDRLGEKINNKSSICYWAHKNRIPIFCPALTDGSLGDILYFHSVTRDPGLSVDIVQDVRRINTIAVQSAKTGVIILGGGVVKHHINNANLMRNGSDYTVFVNTGQEFDGSDSGARPDEAVSWGKVKSTSKAVKVYCDATLVFPLIVARTFKLH